MIGCGSGGSEAMKAASVDRAGGRENASSVARPRIRRFGCMKGSFSRAGFAPGYNQYSTKRADVSTGAERPMFPCCIVPQVIGNRPKLSGIADERRARHLHSGCPTMTVLCQEGDMGHRV